MGITSLENYLTLTIKIDGESLPNQAPNVVREASAIETSSLLFPVMQLELFDEHNIFKKELALNEDNEVKLTLARNINQDKETSRFRITKIKSRPAANGYIHTITGMMDAPKFTKGIKVGSWKNTSSNVLKQVLTESGVRVSRIAWDDTNDDQVWLNPGLTVAQFTQLVTNHSYLSTNAFMRFGITSRGVARYVDVTKALGKRPEHTLVYGDPRSVRGGDYQVKAVEKLAQGGFMGAWMGHGYNLYQPSLKGELMKSDGVALDISGGYAPMSKASATVDAVRQDYAPHDAGNTHEKYWSAYHANMRKATLLNQGIVVMVEEFTKIELFDICKLVFPSMVSLPGRDDNTNKEMGGTYIVSGRKRFIRGTKYAEFIRLHRFAITEQGSNELVSVSSSGKSPEPTQVPQEQDGKSQWTAAKENRRADPKFGCRDIVDEEPLPTSSRSTKWDEEGDWEDRNPHRVYEVATTQLKGLVKTREKDTDI